jgi:hypothetical protein
MVGVDTRTPEAFWRSERIKLSSSCKTISSCLDDQKTILSLSSHPCCATTMSSNRCTMLLEPRPVSGDYRMVHTKHLTMSTPCSTISTSRHNTASDKCLLTFAFAIIQSATCTWQYEMFGVIIRNCSVVFFTPPPTLIQYLFVFSFILTL